MPPCTCVHSESRLLSGVGECYYFKPHSLKDVDALDPLQACDHFNQVCSPHCEAHIEILISANGSPSMGVLFVSWSLIV